jgi:hypothetical protein
MIGDSVRSHFRISDLDQLEYWEKQKPQQDKHPAKFSGSMSLFRRPADSNEE